MGGGRIANDRTRQELDLEALLAFRDRFDLPLSDRALSRSSFSDLPRTASS